MWAYTRFVLERGLLPPAEFDIELTPVYANERHQLIEIVLRLKHLGTHALVASRVALRVRYLTDQDPIIVEPLLACSLFGRVVFPHSLLDDLMHLAIATEEPGSQRRAVEPPVRSESMFKTSITTLSFNRALLKRIRSLRLYRRLRW